CAYTDAADVERVDGDVVTVSLLSQPVVLRDAQAVELELACGTGPDPELPLVGPDDQPGCVPRHQEGRDAVHTVLGRGVGEHDEDAGLSCVGRPDLSPFQHVVVAIATCP